ncbi:AraC family transcriptional regulator [Thermodesulfobacteriota bacterium]
MEQDATASTGLVQILMKYTDGIGLDSDGICRSVGLDPEILKDTEARISLEQFNAIWKETARQAGDRDFGLHFAERAHVQQGGGILLPVMMNCPTLGAAIEKFVRYHDLVADVIRPGLDVRFGRLHLSSVPIHPGLILHRHHSEAILSMFLSVLRALSEDRIKLVEVRFSHSQPAEIDEHERIFRAPLLFGQPQSELVIEEEALSLPIFLANPMLLEVLEQHAQKLLDRLYGEDGWTNRVIQLIGETLLRGDRPGIEPLASGLAMSTRNLQKRLKEEGKTYQNLLDQVREQIALDYLEKEDTTLCDIAFLLGFSDQSAFNHAFKRWTGETPGDYRGSRK